MQERTLANTLFVVENSRIVDEVTTVSLDETLPLVEEAVRVKCSRKEAHIKIS